MSADKMSVDKMSLYKMPADKMSVDNMAYCGDPNRSNYSEFDNFKMCKMIRYF